MPPKIDPVRSLSVHPIYSLENDDSGPPVPTFPFVLSGWAGFYLEELHCVGFREGLETLTKRNPPLEVISLHEDISHWSLGGSLLARLIRLNTLEMWTGIQ